MVSLVTFVRCELIYCFHFFSFQGEKSFFLRPGERLENEIQSVYILGEDGGLILRAIEEFEEENKVKVYLVFKCLALSLLLARIHSLSGVVSPSFAQYSYCCISVMLALSRMEALFEIFTKLKTLNNSRWSNSNQYDVSR